MCVCLNFEYSVENFDTYFMLFVFLFLFLFFFFGIFAGDGTHVEFGHHMSEVPPPSDDENETNAHLKSS